MKKTQILSIYPYLRGSKIIGIGTTAVCFLMKDDRVLKVFINTYGKEYLFNKFPNIIEHFESINSLKNKTYVVPEELIIKDDKCIAYIYNYVDSRTFRHIKLNTKIDTLIYGYDKLYEDTMNISSKKFCLYDLHDKNLLFDGFYHIIDLDKGTFENDKDEEYLSKINMRLINKTILYSLLRVKNYEIMDFYNINLKESYKDNILKDPYGMKLFLKDLVEYEKEIKTIFDMKLNSNKLIHKQNNDYYRHY